MESSRRSQPMGDPCSSVDAELRSLAQKLARFDHSGRNHIDEVIHALTMAKNTLLQVKTDDASMGEARAVLDASLSQCCSSLTSVAAEHRELHTAVSKVGKVVERGFVSDYDATARKEAFQGPRQQRRLDQVVLNHLYRQGNLEIGDTLAQEANLRSEKEEDEVIACDEVEKVDISSSDEKHMSSRMQREAFLELNSVIDALNKRDLKPALAWAISKREILHRQDDTIWILNNNENCDETPRSALEMKLHRLHFVQLLNAKDAKGAVQYARQHFPGFGKSKEVQQLMGAVVFAGRLQHSPYSYLLKDELWIEVQDEFVKSACSLMGLPVESPLNVVLNAGCRALPALLNIKQVMQQQRQTAGVWCVKDELPIEIDLGRDSHFHSIFACPILRQQTSDLNPPLRLTCGHCISKDALAKLSTGHKIKCPYCPVEQNPNDARRITF